VSSGPNDGQSRLPLAQRIARHHYTPRELLALDVIAVILLVVLTVTAGPHKSPRLPASAALTFDRVSDIVGAGAVLYRRRFPRVALAVLLPVAVGVLALRAEGAAPFYLAIVLYSAIVVAPRRTGMWVASAVLATGIIAVVIGGGDLEASSVIGIASLLLLGWVAAEYVRANRRYARYLVQREHERATEAAAVHAEQIEQAIAGERIKIARDLHDIVAHAMSVIAVRAGVARMVIDTQPEQAREALSIIETTTRRSLQEMRLLVGMLRDTDEHAAELGPVPGVEDLARLLREIELAGVSVHLDVAGAPRPLPPAADLSVYRIIQEALTNVVRHAGPTHARVKLTYRPAEITIEVSDSGPLVDVDTTRQLAHPGTGHGLIGMRERTALFGGTLRAEPRDRGFRIQASLRTDD
jgi:signal transduction histidine kinase